MLFHGVASPFVNLPSATVDVSSGGSVFFNAGFSNSGAIAVNGAALTVANGPWHNFGTISGTNATFITTSVTTNTREDNPSR